jgi:hypothetical protein
MPSSLANRSRRISVGERLDQKRLGSDLGFQKLLAECDIPNEPTATLEIQSRIPKIL